MRAMPRRQCWLSSVVSTSLTTVKTPSTKTAGSTIAANGINTSVEPATNPIATSELESAMTYNVLRAEASEYVALFAVCNTKCSVVSTDSSASRSDCSPTFKPPVRSNDQVQRAGATALDGQPRPVAPAPVQPPVGRRG